MLLLEEELAVQVGQVDSIEIDLKRRKGKRVTKCSETVVSLKFQIPSSM